MKYNKYKKLAMQIAIILIISGAAICLLAFSITKFDIEKFKIKTDERKWYTCITLFTD